MIRLSTYSFIHSGTIHGKLLQLIESNQGKGYGKGMALLPTLCPYSGTTLEALDYGESNRQNRFFPVLGLIQTDYNTRMPFGVEDK